MKSSKVKRIIKRKSLYLKMGVLVTVALFVAVLSFLILNYLSEISIEKIWDSDRIEKENQKYIDEFKKFVSDNELKSTDKKIISKWVKEKKIISLSLYKHNQSNDISDYTYEPQDWSFLGDKTANQEVKYYTINFKDRNLQAVIVGSYDISIYHYSNVISLVISFIIMMAIVFAGMRREVKYIRTLYLETQILEGGNLEYEITVRGTDELSELAHEINSMRISLKDQYERDIELTETNQRMITEISHDLRTPLTTILLYTEIIKKHKYRDLDEANEYIEKIEKKVYHMKGLSEKLLEYSMLAEKDSAIELQEENFRDVFYELLSEMVSYEEQQGFNVVFNGEWPENTIEVYDEYIMRIVNNITSNIEKYANPKETVTIDVVSKDGYTGLRFKNCLRVSEDKTDSKSRGIGIVSIKHMMKNMRGQCEVKMENNKFSLTIYFKNY